MTDAPFIRQAPQPIVRTKSATMPKLVSILTRPAPGASPGNGVVDDAPYWNDLLAAGKTIVLDPSKSYLLKSPVIATVDDTGIIAPQGATVRMSVASGAFDNTVYADRYSVSNSGHKYAVGISASNVAGLRFNGFKLKASAWTDCRYLSPLWLFGCDDASVTALDISQFSRTRGGIRFEDCARFICERNRIHDFYSRSAYEADGTTPATSAYQITGIEIDNNGTVGSSDFSCSDNFIWNMTPSAALIAVAGHQTDGININGPNRSRDGRIIGNTIRNVGEGIDTQTQDTIIAKNRITRAFGAGIKLIHGASRNLVEGNKIYESGYVGILGGGSSSVSNNADDNIIRANTIKNVNRPIDWFEADGVTKFYTTSGGSTYWKNTYNSGFGTTTAEIRFDIHTVGPSQMANTLVEDNEIDGGTDTTYGAKCDYGFYIENKAGGYAQKLNGNRFGSFSGADFSDGQKYLVFEDRRLQRLESQSNYTLTNQTTVQEIFNSAVKSAITVKSGRKYRITGALQITSLSASTNSISLAFGGTATWQRANIIAIGKKGGGSGGTLAMANFAALPNATGLVATPADTQQAGQIFFNGFATCSGDGTLIPELLLNTNSAAAVVTTGAWIEIVEDMNAAVSVGDWS